MSTTTGQPAYYPLGLPPGSVRALLTLMIAGLFWLLLLLPPRPPGERPIEIPTYLYALLPMVLLFFAAHGKSIRPEGVAVPSPLYLPRGIVRTLLVLGFIAAVGWKLYEDPELLHTRLTPKPEQLWQVPGIMAALGIGFLLGHLSRVGPWRNSPKYQNLVAWVSLLAMLALLVEIVIELIIKPGLVEEWQPFTWECILTGLVAFYFGARS